MKNLLDVKTKEDKSQENMINNSHHELNYMDKLMTTITEKIKQNNQKFNISNKVSRLLIIAVIVFIVFSILFIIYYSMRQ